MCNEEYMKNFVQIVRQNRMAYLAEVRKKWSNFQTRHFKEKCLFIVATNSTLNTMVSFALLVIVCTARIA